MLSALIRGFDRPDATILFSLRIHGTISMPAFFRLRVTPEQAKKLVASIPSDKCKRAIRSRWHVRDGRVQGTSVLWLFCWDWSGMGSDEAADKAREVFDDLFWVGFDEFEAKVSHDWALTERYRTGLATIYEVERRLGELFGHCQEKRIRVANIGIPEEIPDSGNLIEGAVSRITVNSYERNVEARRRCIKHHGARCVVCDFDFGQGYGEVAEGLIHVHHLKPISEVGEGHVVDPVGDLRPVCPNCHAVIHLRSDPPYSIEEVRGFLDVARKSSTVVTMEEQHEP